ncbi:MAG TPA: right-handed parallel beta-helix repeat-containing protein [Solirubrobacteraceae bacterium]|nr:right-handed parallel beta-helix repeat-containing protein [Solirubrobacteraceae bacterium]
MGKALRATASIVVSLAGVLLAASGAWAAGAAPVLYASPSGGSGVCSVRVPCSLENAISAAAPGDVVYAFAGVYNGGFVVDKAITLHGAGAVIDASSSPFGNGVQIVGPGGSGSSVEGFRIEDAKFEGILVGTAPVAPETENGEPVTSGEPVSDVRIANNTLTHNGTGFGTNAGQCYSTPEAPGDCGETIHLVAVTNSTVEGNYVEDNVGGILLTDEFGPTSGNVVRLNRTIGNDDDCGITLAGHSSAAVNPETGMPTGAAGVFDNVVESNTSDENGVAGQGAGILLGGGAPFAGVYDNLIRNNYAYGNGLSGVTVHQHLIGDLNDNTIEGNVLLNNNLDGDFDFAAAAATETTGILVASGEPPGPPLPPELLPGPISGTVIRGNFLYSSKVGIWTLGVETASTQIAHNVFGQGVKTPISEH